MELRHSYFAVVSNILLTLFPLFPDQPNIFLYLTFKNMAAYGGNIGDKGIEQEYVARKVIGSTEFQNKKRVERSEYRKVLGIELIREIILK